MELQRILGMICVALTNCLPVSISAEENASNPLAAVNNTDLRYQYYDLGNGTNQQDAIIDGAYMVHPKLKFKYEVHYQSSDASGSQISEFSRVNLKAIYFPSETLLNETWGMRVAVGLEWILDFGSLALWPTAQEPDRIRSRRLAGLPLPTGKPA